MDNVKQTWLDNAGGITYAASDVLDFATGVISEIEDNTFNPENYDDFLWELSSIEQDIFFCATELKDGGSCFESGGEGDNICKNYMRSNFSCHKRDK